MNNPYHVDVPDAQEFESARAEWREAFANAEDLRKPAVELHALVDQYQFGYQWEWCGVPIIRLPDDIVLFQEMVWAIQPRAIVETGVARGGSVVLSASLMAMTGIKPAVLGLDILIHQHTYDAINGSIYCKSISLWEGDSAGPEARKVVEGFISAHSDKHPVILVLDSDHTHDHVLNELRNLTSDLPSGSIIVVADTIVEEMPDGYYAERPWGKGNNPLSAVNQFLMENKDFIREERFGRRGLLTEFRDGVIRRR